MNAFLKLMLKGSVVSAMALTLAAVGCSDSDKDTPGAGGESGKAGSSTSGSTNGGESGNVGGGTADGGAKTEGGATADGGAKTEGGAAGDGGAKTEGGAAGDGGAGGANDGIAVAKFCNTLTLDDEPTTLILQVGEGASAVTFTATTGECVPADGVACTEVPTGPEVMIQLFDADAPATAIDFSTTEILGGEKWLFFTDTDANQPIWNGAVAKKNVTCEELTYDDVP